MESKFSKDSRYSVWKSKEGIHSVLEFPKGSTKGKTVATWMNDVALRELGKKHKDNKALNDAINKFMKEEFIKEGREKTISFKDPNSPRKDKITHAVLVKDAGSYVVVCLLYTSPSPRD